jgi:hypothetical protein
MVALAVMLGLIWLVVAFVLWLIWLTDRDKFQQAAGREVERRRNDARLESLARIRDAAEQAQRDAGRHNETEKAAW